MYVSSENEVDIMTIYSTTAMSFYLRSINDEQKENFKDDDKILFISVGFA